MKAVLSNSQLREAMDRVSSGEKLTRVAEAMGVERSALNQRLKRRFPSEYEAATNAGTIRRGGTRENYDRRTLEMENHPAIQACLKGGRTLKDIAAQHEIPLSTLHRRFQRILQLQKERAEALLPKP